MCTYVSGYSRADTRKFIIYYYLLLGSLASSFPAMLSRHINPLLSAGKNWKLSCWKYFLGKCKLQEGSIVSWVRTVGSDCRCLLMAGLKKMVTWSTVWYTQNDPLLNIVLLAVGVVILLTVAIYELHTYYNSQSS